jgi:hypothetical protein
LFADLNEDQAYNDGSDAKIKTYSLSKAEIRDLWCNENSVSALDIVFKRPIPTVYLKKGGGIISCNNGATVTLKSGLKEKTINIYITGLIETE